MRLLFDENLSLKLVEQVSTDFPDSSHVEPLEERGCTDVWLWNYAIAKSLTIVSKDNDFRQLAVVAGPPPKVIWLSIGNAGTSTIAALLHKHSIELERFATEKETSLFVLELDDLNA